MQNFFHPSAWSIVTKITVMSLAAAVLPVSLLTYYNLQRVLAIAETNEFQKLELLAKSTADNLDEVLASTQSDVLQLSTNSEAKAFLAATTPEAQAVLRTPLQQTLKNIAGSSSSTESIFLLDKKGIVQATADSKLLAANLTSRNYFQQAIHGKRYISSISKNSTTSGSSIFFSAPVKDSGGQILGVAVVKMKAEAIWNIINALRVGSNGDSFLVDQLGIIISDPDRSQLFHSLASLSTAALQQVKTEGDYNSHEIQSLDMPDLAKAVADTQTTSHYRYYSPRQHAEQLIGCARLKKQSFVVGVKQPNQQVADPLHDLARQDMLTAIAIAGIAVIVAYILARSVAKPIHALTQAAQNLDESAFNPKPLVEMSHTRNDVGQLVSVFLKMAEEIKMREDGLKQQIAELHTKIKTVREGKSNNPAYLQQLQQKVKNIREKKEKV